MSFKAVPQAGFVVGVLLLGLVFAPRTARAACEFQQGVGQGNFAWDCSAGGSNAPARAPRNNFGAIAISSTTLDFGEAHSYGSLREAQRLALEDCGKVGGARDCKLVVYVQNGCMALVTSAKPGAWGIKTSANRAGARQGAFDACRSNGGLECALVVDRCM